MEAPPSLVAILNDPRLRSARAEELAAVCGDTPSQASASIAAAFAALTGRPPPRDPRLDLSVDDLTVLAGDPAFVSHPFHGAHPMPSRNVFILGPEATEAIVSHCPELARTHWVQFWRQENGGVPRTTGGPLCLFHDSDGSLTIHHDEGAHGPKGPPKSYRPPGTPGLYRSNKQWSIPIMDGYTASEIALWYTGKPERYMELLKANPDYPQVGGPVWVANFAPLKTGTTIVTPIEWAPYISSEGDWGTKGEEYPEAPADVATIPVPDIEKKTTGDDYEASLPDGRIAALKGELGAIASRFPSSGLGGYPGPYDLNDTIDEAFRAAVLKFQKWANGQRYVIPGMPGIYGTPSLAETGRLDSQTVFEIDTYATKVAVTGGTPEGVPDPFKSAWPVATGEPGPAGPGKTLDTSGGPYGGGGAAAPAATSSGEGGLAIALALGAAVLFA